MVSLNEKYLLRDGKTIITITKMTEKSVSVSYKLTCDCGISNCYTDKKGTIQKEQLKLYSLLQEV